MEEFRRFLYRFALVLTGFALILSLLVGGGVFWVVQYPASAWGFVQKHFLPQDLKVQWESIAFKGERKSWLHWDIEWHAKNLKIEKTKPAIELPLDSVDLVFSLELFRPRTRLGFSQVQITGEKTARWSLVSDESEETEPLNPYHRFYNASLRYLHWANRYSTLEKLDVHLDDVQIQGLKPKPITARLRLAKPKGEAELRSTALTINLEGTNLKSDVNATLSMDNFDTPTPFLSAQVKWADEKLHLDGETHWAFFDDKFSLKYKGKDGLILEKGETEFNWEWTGSLKPQGAEVFVTMAVSGIPGPLAQLKKVTGEFHMAFNAHEFMNDEPASFKVSGPVELFFIDQVMRHHLEGSCKCKLPTELMVNLDGRLFTKELFSPVAYKRPVAEVSIQTESIQNKLFTMDFSAMIKVSKSSTEWLWDPEVNSRVSILSFQGLKGLLEAKNLMVPAPFDVLDGTIDFTAKGPMIYNKDGSRATITVKSNLSSEHQKVVTETQVQLALDPSLNGMDVMMKLNIQDFQVELPPIDPIAGIPALRADSRIQLMPSASTTKTKVESPSRFKLRLSWAAATQKPGAIRLLSKYASPHIPISMDIQRGLVGDVVGYVKLEPFQIRYLRRILTVEQLRILADERDKAADFPVDGRVRVDQTQYAVFMEISGTLRAPFIKLSSEPELPRSDIISVLLFDRKQDQLAGGDAETAGQFEAAMADRAIGLLGLWAFASTPIRSFSYNASTKVYAATVAVADGVTASVGTNWEEAAHLEVRKRISKRWVLTASWTPSERDDTQTGRLVLQWEKRF